MRIHKVVITHKLTNVVMSWQGYAEDEKEAQALFLRALSDELLNEIVQESETNFKIEIYRAKEPK